MILRFIGAASIVTGEWHCFSAHYLAGFLTRVVSGSDIDMHQYRHRSQMFKMARQMRTDGMTGARHALRFTNAFNNLRSFCDWSRYIDCSSEVLC